MDARCVFGFMVLLCVNVSSISRSKLPEVTQGNFQQRLKEKKYMFLYATKDNCGKCNLLYNKFVTVSQTFADDPDIFFGQVLDKALAKVFEVETFPAVVFYEFGSAVPKTYHGDITVGALTKLVTKAIKEDFRLLDVRYAVQLTTANFKDIIGNDKQYRLIMLHEGNDVEEIGAFDEVAETFDNDYEIVFARIDVDVEKYLDNHYIAKSYPSFYWYEKGVIEKKKRYGGELRPGQMIAFINQQTGFQRLKKGGLTHYAGLIKPIDDVLYKHGKSLYEIRNIDQIKTDVKAAIKKLPKETDKELTDYYMHLLDELDEDGTVETIGESQRRLHREMDEAGPLKTDQLFKKRNIVQKLLDIISKQMLLEVTDGTVKISQDLQDYISAAGAADHGLEFHEEF